MGIQEYLNKHKFIYQHWNNLNQYNTDPNQLNFNKNDVNTYNELITMLKASDLNTIIRTQSGAIANGKNKYNNNYAWDIKSTNSYIRLTISIYGKVWVFRFGNDYKKDRPEIYPNVAFAAFKHECALDGIDLDKYKIDNGEEIKKTIQKPLILFNDDIKNKVYENVFHIDFHNSYPAGLCNTHPEFRKTVERIYNMRKDNDKSMLYKAILNYSIGWMQSLKNGRKAEWAHLAADAIRDNNRRILELAIRLQATGRAILGFNTDGIWYQGKEYHGDGEGPNLGQWQNDHAYCTFRAKSNGIYEYMEACKYYPVVRGVTELDMYKPREEWKWGDIYNTPIILYKLNKETLLLEEEYTNEI